MLPRLRPGQTFEQQRIEREELKKKWAREEEERIAKMSPEELAEYEAHVLRVGLKEEREKILYRGKTPEQIEAMKKAEEEKLEEISRRAREYEKAHKGEISSDFEFSDDDYIVGHGRREDGQYKISNKEIYGDEK